MEYQPLINYGFASFFAVAGWFAREHIAAMKEIKGDISKMRETGPTTYVLKEDYRRDIIEIKAMLTKLYDRIDKL